MTSSSKGPIQPSASANVAASFSSVRSTTVVPPHVLPFVERISFRTTTAPTTLGDRVVRHLAVRPAEELPVGPAEYPHRTHRVPLELAEGFVRAPLQHAIR